MIKMRHVLFGGLMAAGFCIAACNTSPSVQVDTTTDQAQQLSEGRLAAARRLLNTTPVYVDILQRSNPVLMNACDPLGTTQGAIPWASTIGGPAPFLPNWNFEYDRISAKGDTDYIVAIRAGIDAFPAQYSQVELNVRAVNPRSNGHVAGTNYQVNQATLPSNDNLAANRSLFDMSGGDVAVVVQGLTFDTGAPLGSTLAQENFLGPHGWLFFLRDNSFPTGGRFYAIAGGLKGGPPGAVTPYYVNPLGPPAPAPGVTQSVQVNGIQFDLLSEPQANTNDALGTLCQFAPPPGNPTPGKPYAFVDRSNRNELGIGGPANAGRGGYIFLIRREAFNDGNVRPVVANPAAAPPALPLPVDLAGPFASGYNEFVIPPPLITPPPQNNNTGNGPPGVHELAISVFYVHTPPPPGP